MVAVACLGVCVKNGLSLLGVDMVRILPEYSPQPQGSCRKKAIRTMWLRARGWCWLLLPSHPSYRPPDHAHGSCASGTERYTYICIYKIYIHIYVCIFVL